MVSPVRFWLSAFSALAVEAAGVVQLVERLLAKEKVVGSSPIARSFYPSGDVAKW
jgi:hypothetical protein